MSFQVWLFQLLAMYYTTFQKFVDIYLFIFEWIKLILLFSKGILNWTGNNM